MRRCSCWLLAVGIGLIVAAPVEGQVPDSSRVRELRGCWAITTGEFTGTAVDSGMTSLPSVVRLDTVPGSDFLGRPDGWRVQSLPLATPHQWRVGVFKPVGDDSVVVSWTSGGFVGVRLALVTEDEGMRGEAIAWTDYGGQQQAPVAMRRTACPAS